jgi:hypothetical protein
MTFVSVQFCQTNSSASQSHLCNSFQLSPAPSTIHSFQARKVADGRASGDAFYVMNLANDFKIHTRRMDTNPGEPGPPRVQLISFCSEPDHFNPLHSHCNLDVPDSASATALHRPGGAARGGTANVGPSPPIRIRGARPTGRREDCRAR